MLRGIFVLEIIQNILNKFHDENIEQFFLKSKSNQLGTLN